VLEHDPADLLALDGLAALCGELGRPAERARLLARAIELDDAPRATARRLVELAGQRGAAGAVDEALTLARRAAELEPDDGAGFGAYEQLAYRHERWSQLVQFYAEVLERAAGGRRAGRGDLHLRWAQVLRRQLGDPDAALAQVQLAITTDGDLEQITYALEQLAPAPHELHATLAALRRRATSAHGEARDQAVFAAVRVAALGEVSASELELLVGMLPPSAPWPTDVYDALERVHERRADWHRLLAVLRRRLAVTPSGPIHVALARRIATLSEQHLRDSRLAVEHYQRVLQGQPDNRDALEALARIHEATEAWPEFLDINRRLIGLTTDRTARGLLLFRCGSVSEAKFGAVDDAVRYYEAAIKTSSTCMPAVHGLRDLYRRRQRWADVARTLEVEVDMWEDEKEQAGVYAQLAEVCAQHLGDPARAAAMYARALEVDPGCLPANRALFEGAFAEARWADAVRHAEVLAGKAGRDGDAAARAEFAARRAVALRHTGNHRAALASARAAVEASPTSALGLDELLALAPQVLGPAELEDLWRELERALRRRDDTRGQLARLEVARARQAMAAGDLDGVAHHARLAASRAPGDADVIFALVELDVAQRRWAEAAARLRLLLDGPVDEARRIAALWRLAELHASGEVRPESALAVLAELAALCPDDPEVPYRAAQEAVALGRLDDARQHIEHALALAARPELAAGAGAVARLAAPHVLRGAHRRRPRRRARRDPELPPRERIRAGVCARRAGAGAARRR
jgi:tetratricopeptide (TPR) repeat protein